MRALVIFIAASMVSAGLPALAAPADADKEAREHFDAGIALVQKHDFANALVELEQSYAVNALPETLLDIALCERELGRYVSAAAKLHRYLGMLPPADQAKSAEAKQLLELTESQLALLVVEAPRAATVELDGRPLPERRDKVDPGPHRVVGTLGPHSAEVHITIAPGESQTVSLPLVEDPPAPALVTAPPPSPPAAAARLRLVDTIQGRAAIGVGAAALGLFVAGAVTGGLVLADKSTYHASCERFCDGALYDRAHALAITNDLLFAVGGAAAITSLVLFLAHPRRAR
jgi:tetratricopeptide (TPR) repeat protein